MLLYPQDLHLLTVSVIVPFVVEFFRIFLAYLMGGPSSKIFELEDQKAAAQIELSSIKSVQLELVRHSKLERQVIKLDKEIEALKASQAPKGQKVRSILRYARMILYVLAGIYLGTNSLVLISPEVIWPLAFFSSEITIGLQGWFIVLVTASAARHVYRSFIPLLCNPASCP